MNEMMLGMSQQIRVRQLFDCADVAKTFVGDARQRGKRRNVIQGPNNHAASALLPRLEAGYATVLGAA